MATRGLEVQARPPIPKVEKTNVHRSCIAILNPTTVRYSTHNPASVPLIDSQQCSWTRTTESNSVTLASLKPSPRLALRKHTSEYVHTKNSWGEALTSIFPDTILHVARAHAGEGVRFQVRYLVPWLPDIRTLRIKTAIPRGKDSLRAKCPGTQRSNTSTPSGLQSSSLQHHQGHAEPERMSVEPYHLVNTKRSFV